MATITEALTVAVQYQKAGHFREAEQIYRQIVQADPGHAEAWCYLGMICLTSGRVDEAVGCCQQAVALRPDFAPAQDALAQALRHQGQPLSGSLLSERGQPSEFQLQDASACNRQGIALFQQGRLEESVAQFQQALRIRPDYPEAHTNLGNLFYYQGRHDQAVACYQQALRLNPQDAGTYNNLGNVLYHQGKYDDAVAACQNALKLAPGDAGVHNNLANALLGLEKFEEAVANYQQAVSLKPEYAEAHNNLGQALLRQDRRQEAAVSFEQALHYKPDYAEARTNLEALRDGPALCPTESTIDVPDWMNGPGGQVDVSIIVPMFRARDVITRQIGAWDLATDGLIKEIIYVDNGCPQDSAGAVMAAWSNARDKFLANGEYRIRIVKLTPNCGFGGACNVGVRHARGSSLVFLNADTVVTPNWIRPMIDKLQSDSKIGLVGSLVIKPDGTIDSAGSEWLWEFGTFFHIGLLVHQGKRIPRPMHVNEAPADVFQPGERDMITGCCIAMPKKLFDEIGGWDTGYKVGYYEDCDLNMEIRSRGYKIYFEPRSVIYHWTAHSGCGNHPYVTQNYIRFCQKWVLNRKIDGLVKTKRPPGLVNRHV